MRKISFKNFGNAEVLTRDELRKVSGGDDEGSGDSCGTCTKYNVSGAPTKATCYSETIRGNGGATMSICTCPGALSACS